MKTIKLLIAIYFLTTGFVFLCGAILQALHNKSSLGMWLIAIILLAAGKIVTNKIRKEEDL